MKNKKYPKRYRQNLSEERIEIKKLTEEEAKKDINRLREDLSILFEQEDKGMKDSRKLSYSEHWMKHWRKKIAEQYIFFYNLGLDLIKEKVKVTNKRVLERLKERDIHWIDKIFSEEYGDELI